MKTVIQNDFYLDEVGLSGWGKSMLGNLVDIFKGKLTIQSEFPGAGLMSLINADAVNKKAITYSHTKSAILCDETDILMLWDGERSGLVTIGHKGVVGSTFSKLKILESIESKYLYYFLQEKFSWIQNNRTGTGVPHVPKDLQRILFVTFPKDKAFQRKIANILTTADAVIENTQATIAKYKAIKKGMLHDLFTRGIEVKTGKLRPKFENAPALYKESKLGMVPIEWEDCSMGKYIVENLYGPRFNAKDYAENGNVKTIRGTDFSKEGILLYEQAPKALLSDGLINTHKLKNNDVVIVTTADCGLTAVFEKPLNDVDFIPSAYSVKFRFAQNVNPYFVKYFMATDLAIRLINKFVRQGTLGNLPGSDILNFTMIYPCREEQDHIVNRITLIHNQLQTEQAYLQKLYQLKSGLMNDLLSGKKGVNI